MSSESHADVPVPTYQVRLVNPAKGLDHTLTVPANEYILDIALQSGLALPHSCQIGCCSTCVSILQSGTVNQGDQCILNAPELAANMVVICCALPTSDCTLLTHQHPAYLSLNRA